MPGALGLTNLPRDDKEEGYILADSDFKATFGRPRPSISFVEHEVFDVAQRDTAPLNEVNKST